MPIYEYQCGKCGHAFDALQKLGEAALRKCPECGKAALSKLVSAPAVQGKGQGQGEGSQSGHSHSHGGHSHTHGPGCGHKH